MPEEIATEATLKEVAVSVSRMADALEKIHHILKDVWSEDSRYLRVHQTAASPD